MAREPLPTQQNTRIEKLSLDEEKAFELLVPRHKAGAIDQNSFKGLEGYSEESIRRDNLDVEAKKGRIKTKGTEPLKRAKLLEALLAEQIELSDWFGPDVLTIIPAEYDDLFNGIDAAIEFAGDEGEFKYLAMGIDITLSPDAIANKLARIKKHIEDGTLTEMRYFTSERNEYKGRMPQVPNVVIGVDGKTIEELAELWLAVNGARLTNKTQAPLSEETAKYMKERLREAKEKLARHRVQVLILKQIESQLTVYRDFAVKNRKYELVKKYDELLKLVRNILKNKKISDEGQEKNNKDRVSMAITNALDRFDGYSAYDRDDWTR